MSGTTKAQKQEQEEARDRLREILSPGDTVYTILRHVSRSGMSRQLSVFTTHNDEPYHLTWNAAKACRYSMKGDYLVVGGCGFDAGFDVVYSIGQALWPDGFECIAPRVYLFDDEIREGRYPHIAAYETRDIGYGVEVGEIDPHPLSGKDAWGKREYRVWDHNCPSNDHSNHEYSSWHESGGYALRHRWM